STPRGYSDSPFQLACSQSLTRLSNEAARVHHFDRRRGGLAARGPRAAAGDAGGRISQQRVGRVICAIRGGGPPGSERNRLYRGQERSGRIPLGRRAI